VVGDELDPVRPDLAIEVVWTSGGINKLEIYRKLGVREVWYWQKGELALYTLRRGRYVRIPRSKVLPGIDHAEVAELASMRPMTKAVREYRKRLAKR
jgi:Uma2 family endonuclease